MTSPRRRQGSPVESVTLRITFEGTGKELSGIRRAIPSAVAREGGCEVTIRAATPEAVAERARELLERLRGVA